MYPKIRVYVYDEAHQKIFGEGPCELLHAIETTGSLKCAAFSMNMAYTKALSILKRAEAALGFSLTHRKTGGKGGGGSILTPEAKEFLKKYETYRDACVAYNQQIYYEIFSPESEETPSPHRQ